MKITTTLLFSFICIVGFSQSKTGWISDTTLLDNGNKKIMHKRELGKRQAEIKTYIYNKCGDEISFEHQKYRATKNRIDYTKNKRREFESACNE